MNKMKSIFSMFAYWDRVHQFPRRTYQSGKKVRRVIWEECGAYIHIVSETIVAVCDGQFFPCVFKDSEDILATDWEEV